MKGVCEMYEMGWKILCVAQYSRSGNVRVDQEMSYCVATRAARFRSKEKGSLSERVGKPGLQMAQKLNASEFIGTCHTFYSCPNDGIDKDPIPCSTDSIMDRDDVMGPW